MDFTNSPESSAAFDYGRDITDNMQANRPASQRAKVTGSSSSHSRFPKFPRFPKIPPRKIGPLTRRPSASMSKLA